MKVAQISKFLLQIARLRNGQPDLSDGCLLCGFRIANFQTFIGLGNDLIDYVLYVVANLPRSQLSIGPCAFAHDASICFISESLLSSSISGAWAKP